MILALVGTCAGLYLNRTDFFIKQATRFQTVFREKEIDLDTFLKVQKKHLDEHEYEKNSIARECSQYFFHYYRNDSLIYWNSNDLPVGRYADIHYPSNGLIHLQNGWYFAQALRKGNEILCGAFLIKTDYPYENPDLRNEFDKNFDLDKHTRISLDQSEGFAVKNQLGQFVFSLVQLPNREENSGLSQFMLIYYLIIFALWIYLILLLFNNIKSHFKWLLPLLLIVLKYLALNFGLFHFRIGEGALDPSIYGTSKYFPNFFLRFFITR